MADHSDVKALPVSLDQPSMSGRDAAVEKARADGKADGEAGRSMNPDYVNRPDVGLTSLAKQAYAKAYVSAREARGSARRRSKTQKRKVKRSKKTHSRRRK